MPAESSNPVIVSTEEVTFVLPMWPRINPLTNSLRSAFYTWRGMTNPFLHEEDQLFRGKEDDRHWASVYVAGFPGILLGSLVGALTIAVALPIRVITNNIKTALEMLKLCIMVETKGFEPTMKERSAGLRFGVGILGLCAGVVVGTVLIMLAETLKTIYYTLIEGAKTWWSLIKWALPPTKAAVEQVGASKQSKMIKTDDETPEAHLLGKLLGTVMALPFILGIAAVRCVIEAPASFVALSGSFINAAVCPEKTPYFGGISADTRSSGQQALGIVGYLACGLTVAPIATLMIAMRLVVPFLKSIIEPCCSNSKKSQKAFDAKKENLFMLFAQANTLKENKALADKSDLVTIKDLTMDP